MKAIQNMKIVAVTPPAAISDNATLTCASVDTKGWKHCRFVAHLGATDIAMVTLKVQEADDDSTYADVTGAIFGTSTNTAGSTSAVPSATDDNKFFGIDIQMTGARKRYLDVVAVTGDGAAGAFVTIFAILSEPEEAPNTAAEEGFDEMLRVYS